MSPQSANCAQCQKIMPCEQYESFAIESFTTVKLDGASQLKDKLILCTEVLSVTDKIVNFGVVNSEKLAAVISPDYWVTFGKWFFYWFSGEESTMVSLCSRKCAIQYAEIWNAVLYYTKRLAVTPHQATIDQYAQEHQMAHYLASFHDDSWSPPEVELRLMLESEVPSFYVNHLAILIQEVTERGMFELAYQGATKLAEVAPQMVAGTLIANLLAVDEAGYHTIDNAYERVRTELGCSYESLGAGPLSTWAVLIGNGPQKKKARKLARIAYRLDPHDDGVLANYLGVLAHTREPQTLAFLERNRYRLRTHNQYYSAGLIFQEHDAYEKALECFWAADTFWPDATTKHCLAQVLFDLEEYARAIEQVRLGRRTLYEGGGTYQDANGKELAFLELSPQGKDFLEQQFLILEGKSLIHLGEISAGQKKLSKVLELDSLSPELRKDIESYAGSVTTRVQLETTISTLYEQLDQTHSKLVRVQDQQATTKQLFEAIATIQKDWSNELNAIGETLSNESVDTKFSDYVRAFISRIRSLQPDKYETMLDTFRKRYKHLPARSIECIANAHFVMEVLGKTDAPVYTGVIIELSKAVELAVNITLIEPYVAYLNASREPTIRTIATPNGRYIEIRLTTRNQKTRPLMLNDLSVLCASRDNSWKEFVNKRWQSNAVWISSVLPQIIVDIKDKYRNGCAHESSASKSKTLELIDYLKTQNVFERLSALAIGQAK